MDGNYITCLKARQQKTFLTVLLQIDRESHGFFFIKLKYVVGWASMHQFCVAFEWKNWSVKSYLMFNSWHLMNFKERIYMKPPKICHHDRDTNDKQFRIMATQWIISAKSLCKFLNIK